MPFMPLVDAHVHANALATDQDILDLAARYGVDEKHLDFIDRATGKRLWDSDDHGAFHHAYDASVSLIKTPEDIGRITRKALQKAAEENCMFMQILASGLNNFRGNGNLHRVFRENISALISAIMDVSRETDGAIHARISLTAKRHLRDGVAGAHQLLDAYEDYKNTHPEAARFITGFNMAGNEEGAELGIFSEVFERAHSLGLSLIGTHAGEINPTPDVRQALRIPGLTNIGHGLSAVNDRVLMTEIAERGIFVEQLLTLNEAFFAPQRGYPNNHPIKIFHKAGIRLGLGSDDPGIVGTTIRREYQKAAQAYGFSDAELLGMTLNSIHALVPETLKPSMLQRCFAYAETHGLAIPAEMWRPCAEQSGNARMLRSLVPRL